jgi:hypothetical protein
VNFGEVIQLGSIGVAAGDEEKRKGRVEEGGGEEGEVIQRVDNQRSSQHCREYNGEFR